MTSVWSFWVSISIYPLTQMSDLMGCAKIMCEKHGDDSCKQLLVWVDKFGFPDNANFSINQIEALQNKLGKYDKGKTKINQIAFMMCDSKKINIIKTGFQEDKKSHFITRDWLYYNNTMCAVAKFFNIHNSSPHVSLAKANDVHPGSLGVHQIVHGRIEDNEFNIHPELQSSFLGEIQLCI